MGWGEVPHRVLGGVAMGPQWARWARGVQWSTAGYSVCTLTSIRALPRCTRSSTLEAVGVKKGGIAAAEGRM